MPIENLGHEHEFEPQFGLPERLPSDEFIVWQGSPDVGALASSAFHIKKLMVYFLFLIGACAWPALESGAGLHAVLQAIKWIAPLALVGLASVWMLAYMTSRTTVYTITNKRVVMRVGIVLTAPSTAVMWAGGRGWEPLTPPPCVRCSRESCRARRDLFPRAVQGPGQELVQAHGAAGHAFPGRARRCGGGGRRGGVRASAPNQCMQSGWLICASPALLVCVRACVRVRGVPYSH